MLWFRFQTGCFSWWFPAGVLWLFQPSKKTSRSHSTLLCQACSKGWPRLSSFKDWRPLVWGFYTWRADVSMAFWMEGSSFREDSNTTIQEILVSWYVCWICTRNIHGDHGERERVLFCSEDLPAIFLATRHKGHIVFVNTIWVGHVLTLCYNSWKMPQLMVFAKQWWAFAFHSSVRKRLVPVSRPAACLDPIHLLYSFVYQLIYFWCIKTSRECRPRNHQLSHPFLRCLSST